MLRSTFSKTFRRLVGAAILGGVCCSVTTADQPAQAPSKGWQAARTPAESDKPRAFPVRAVPLSEFWEEDFFRKLPSGDTKSTEIQTTSGTSSFFGGDGEYVLAQQPGADQFLVPPPVPSSTPSPGGNQSGGPPSPAVSPDPNVPGSEDSVFRPITRIKPYYDYSPSADEGRAYLCPQPSDIPENERARCPDLQHLPAHGTTARYFAETTFCWEASNLYHKPLYFEDVQLERYGHAYPYGVQPFVSLGKFGVQFVGLPYQMSLDPVWRDHYALGYYRPGEAAPYLCYPVPINLKAAAAAAGVYTGLIFLLQ